MPEIDYPKEKVLLLLPDLFGHEFINNQVRFPSILVIILI
jgi:hypothetical protein